MNISFAQVREDPAIEHMLLNKLKENIDILSISSGGCTILSLLEDKVNQITAIDMNKEQNYLCELKSRLCCYYKDDADKLIKYLQGEYDDDHMLYIFDNLEISQECKTYWQENITYLLEGINRCGKYEQIFRELAKNNLDCGKVFGQDNLIEKFGKNAVKYSNDFVQHFTNIIDTYKAKYFPARNYFYYQILRDKYPILNRPLYMKKLDVINNNINKIKYVNQNMLEYLETCKDGTYNIIQISNITDWMDDTQRNKLITECKRVLKNDGYIVSRKLNGKYSLQNLIGTEFEIMDNIPHDTSEFYKEVVVGVKHLSESS